MSDLYDYIRRTYGVEPRIGQRITVDGEPAVVVRPREGHYLRVRFDGKKRLVNAHPTWRVDYAPPA